MAVVACREGCPGSVAYEWTKESTVAKFWGSVERSGRKEEQEPTIWTEDTELTAKLRPLHQGYITRETSIVVEQQTCTLSPMRWDTGWERNQLCIALWEEGDKEWRQMDPAKVTLLTNGDNASIQKITISCNRCILAYLRSLLPENTGDLVIQYLSIMV
jgi:hypothetical protein